MHKTCIVCGTPSRTSRCPRHTRPRYTWADRQARARFVATATHCWICGQPARYDDPLTADHLVPRAAGGADATWNYRAAHRSCNSRRGATPWVGG